MVGMRSLTVGVKLVGSFSIVALIIAIVAGVGYVNMGAINVGLDSLFTGSLLPVEQLGRANTALYQMRGDVYKYIVLPDQREDTRRAIDTDVALVNTQMDLYRTSPLTAEERSALELIPIPVTRRCGIVGHAQILRRRTRIDG